MTDPDRNTEEAVAHLVCVILFIACVGFAAESGLAATAAFFLVAVIGSTARAFSDK